MPTQKTTVRKSAWDRIMQWVTPGVMGLCTYLIIAKINSYDKNFEDFNKKLDGFNTVITKQAVQETQIGSIVANVNGLTEDLKDHMKVYAKNEEVYRIAQRNIDKPIR